MSTITRSSHRVAFNKAIEKMLLNMSGDFEIDNDAKRYLTTSLYALTRDIAVRASEIVIDDKTPTECIREILPEFLEGEALRCALSNGHSAVLRFASGKEDFVPRKPRPQKQKPIVYELSPSIFIPGIKMLKAGVEKLNTPSRIDSGSKYISEILSRVGEYLASETASNPNKENIGVIDSADVSNTISSIFPQSLLEHAIYYGSRRVTDYETGALKYVKKPRLKSKRKTSKAMPRKRKTSISRTPPKRARKESLKIKTPPKRAKKTPPKIKRPSKRARMPSPKIKAHRKRAKKAAKPPHKKEADSVEETDPKKKSPRPTPRKAATDPEKKAPTDKDKKAPRKDFKSFTLGTLKKSNVKTDSEGVEELNSRLLDLCHSLANECSKTSKDQVSEKTISAVVKTHLPTELARHALSHSHQAIFLAQCDKRVPKTKIGQKKSQETTGETSTQKRSPSAEDSRTEVSSEPDVGEAPSEPDVEEEPSEPDVEEEPSEPDVEEAPSEPDDEESPSESDTVETPSEPDFEEAPSEVDTEEDPDETVSDEDPSEDVTDEE